MTEINTRVEHIDSSTRLFSLFFTTFVCVYWVLTYRLVTAGLQHSTCVYIYEVLARGQLVQEKMVHTGEEQQTLSAM